MNQFFVAYIVQQSPFFIGGYHVTISISCLPHHCMIYMTCECHCQCFDCCIIPCTNLSVLKNKILYYLVERSMIISVTDISFHSKCSCSPVICVECIVIGFDVINHRGNSLVGVIIMLIDTQFAYSMYKVY